MRDDRAQHGRKGATVITVCRTFCIYSFKYVYYGDDTMCVARVSYIYLMYTYINIYYTINTPSTYLCACVTC